MTLNHAPTADYNAKMEFLSIERENPNLMNDEEAIAQLAPKLAQLRIENANRLHLDVLPQTKAA